MIISLFALLLASAPAQMQAAIAPSEDMIQGQCTYSEALRKFRPRPALAICDSLSIERNAGSATFAFILSGSPQIMRFSGDMSGNRMTVKRLELTGEKPAAATGTCEIFRNNGKISTVSCLAHIGPDSYAASFLPLHI